MRKLKHFHSGTVLRTSRILCMAQNNDIITKRRRVTCPYRFTEQDLVDRESPTRRSGPMIPFLAQKKQEPRITQTKTYIGRIPTPDSLTYTLSFNSSSQISSPPNALIVMAEALRQIGELAAVSCFACRQILAGQILTEQHRRNCAGEIAWNALNTALKSTQ